MTLALRTDAVPDSPLARWDARWKLGGLLALTAGTVAVTLPGPAAVAFALSLGLVALGRLPAREAGARIGVLLLPALPILILLPFTASWGVAATFGLRLGAVGLVALVLARTAPISQTFAAAGAVGVPGALVQVGLLAYRYTFLLAGEVVRMRRAWRVRGFQMATGRHAYRTVGQSVGALAVRSEDRAERVAAAMRCRGFDGTVRPLTAFHTRLADVLAFVACAAGAAGLVAADRWP